LLDLFILLLPQLNVLTASSQQQMSDVQQTTVATKAATESIRSDLHTEKIRRCLSPPDPSTNANHARTLRHEGTGVWLLENPVFQSWRSGSFRHLWLHGLAGCGKTILSATVLDYLARANDGLIFFFFFDFSDVTKQTHRCQRLCIPTIISRCR
jgi:predicted ATPase